MIENANIFLNFISQWLGTEGIKYLNPLTVLNLIADRLINLFWSTTLHCLTNLCLISCIITRIPLNNYDFVYFEIQYPYQFCGYSPVRNFLKNKIENRFYNIWFPTPKTLASERRRCICNVFFSLAVTLSSYNGPLIIQSLLYTYIVAMFDIITSSSVCKCAQWDLSAGWMLSKYLCIINHAIHTTVMYTRLVYFVIMETHFLFHLIQLYFTGTVISIGLLQY